MKRVSALLLALALLLTLSPALASEASSSFSDVPADAWYAPYVEVCVDAGLMQGTGNGRFSPSGEVSEAECLALAVRLHYRENGGTGALPKAPPDWGRAVLTESDGSVSELYATPDSGSVLTKLADTEVFALLLTDTPTDLARLFPTGGSARTVTLSLGGQTLPGSLVLQEGYSAPYALFVPDSGETDEVRTLFSDWCLTTSPSQWYRDYVYYANEHSLINRTYVTEWSATRFDLTELLLPAAKELLTPINTVDALPDVDEARGETVLPFYRAGILAGSDRYGTFRGGQGLTRGELSAVAARLVRPDLRLRKSFAAPDYADYTLTALTEVGWSAAASPYGYQSFYSSRHDDGYGQNADLLPVINWSASEQPTAGVLGLDGRWVAAPVYTSIERFGPTGLAIVQKDSFASGVIDRTGVEVVSPTYQYISEVNGDTLLAMKDGRWYALDHAGNVLGRFTGCVEPHESPFYGPSEGLVAYCEGALYTSSHRYGFLNLDGSVAIPAAYFHVLPFSEGLAAVVSKDGVGYVDNTGNMVIPAQYALPGLDADARFHNGTAFVADLTTGLTGAIDKTGNTVIPFRYDFLGVRSDGMSYFERENLRGYLTPEGAELITDYGAYPYTNGYAVARSESSYYYGYMDKDGSLVVPLEFDYCGPMTAQGTAFVVKDDIVYRLTLVPG